jgi:hypothetical protein
VTLLAALLREREREVTDSLVDLLIATVHRIGARAEQRVTKELISAFQKVTGKENILFAIAEASLERPSDAVREVVYPAVRGGEATLRELVREYKTHGPAYRRTVQTTLKASYTGHYRAGLIELLGVLEFRSTNTAHQPVVRALGLIARYARAGNLTYYPAGETAPEHKGTAGEWVDLGLPGRQARRWTRPSSSLACGRRWRPSSPRPTTPCLTWTGSTSPSGAPARSSSPRPPPPPSRATCAGSRTRSPAGGPRSR